MGLPPVQGHNNIRLNHAANMYQNHNFRLDKTQFNTNILFRKLLKILFYVNVSISNFFVTEFSECEKA